MGILGYIFYTHGVLYRQPLFSTGGDFLSQLFYFLPLLLNNIQSIKYSETILLKSEGMPHYGLSVLIMVLHMRKLLLNLNEIITGKHIDREMDIFKLQTLIACFVLFLVGFFYFCL